MMLHIQVGTLLLNPFYRIVLNSGCLSTDSCLASGVKCHLQWSRIQGRSDGGGIYRYIYPPKISTWKLCWNSLPVDVQSAPSLTTFGQKLKSHLFRKSYPDVVF